MKILRSEMRLQTTPNLTVAHFHTLSRTTKGPQTNKELARQYLIQYADPKGQCTQETVEVTTYLATQQTAVIFLPTPRRPCQ